jgi:hypothetical protein
MAIIRAAVVVIVIPMVRLVSSHCYGKIGMINSKVFTMHYDALRCITMHYDALRCMNIYIILILQYFNRQTYNIICKWQIILFFQHLKLVI